MSTITNTKRADWAYRSLQVFRQVTGTHDEDPDTVIRDFLCNLRHYCDEMAVDFDLAWRESAETYQQEIAEEAAKETAEAARSAATPPASAIYRVIYAGYRDHSGVSDLHFCQIHCYDWQLEASYHLIAACDLANNHGYSGACVTFCEDDPAFSALETLFEWESAAPFDIRDLPEYQPATSQI